MTHRQVIHFSLFCLLACTSARTEEAWRLYDDSEVGRIEITCDPDVVDWLYQGENLHSDSLHPASLRFQNGQIDETVHDIGFRLRGNTSRQAMKKSFKVSFNGFVPGREFYEVDKLNLNGEHNDPSIVRSKLCWDLYQLTDMPTSRAAHSEVWINEQYFGLYISIEHIDDEFLWKHFDDDSGNLWKCLWPADLGWRGTNPDAYKVQEGDHRTYDLKTNKDEDDYQALYELIRLLHHCPDESIEDSLGQYLDVAGVLQYFAMNVLTGSWDDYWFLSNNYYLYHDPTQDRMTLIPYDYDNSFSVDWFGLDWAMRNPYSFGSTDRSLAERILDQPRWRNLYTHILEHWLETLFAAEAMEARLISLYNQNYAPALADSFRSLDYEFDMMDYINSWGPSYQNMHVRRGLREYISIRRSSLPGQLNWQEAGPEAWRLEWNLDRPCVGDTLDVASAAFANSAMLDVTLQWKLLDGSWQSLPMSFTGNDEDARLSVADRYSCSLPLEAAGQLLLRVHLEDAEGRQRTYPPLQPRSLFVSPAVGPLVLNEFLASNDSQGQDPDGEFDDWVELYNIGPEAVPLAGSYLTDDADNLTQWVFPPETPELEAGAFMLVWCDEDEDQEGYHSSFSLSRSGEFLALTAPDGLTVHDSLSYGSQQTDISYGRLPDGTGQWQALDPPSPGEENLFLSVDEQPVVAQDFQMQTWPNPFNAGLTIRLPNGARWLRVYNLAGEEVSRHSLKDTQSTYRLSEQDWEGLPSGVYLLECGNRYQRTRAKVTHLK